MVEPKHDLARWAQLIIERRITKPDEYALITYLHRLAHRQLERRNIRALAKFVLTGYDLHELAYMFIEDLVLPKDDISFYSLYRSLNSMPMDIAIATSRELEEFLERIIAVAIRDSLHSIYFEWDAAYTRVHRAVENHLRSNENYSIILRFREKLGYRNTTGIPFLFADHCPREELLAQLYTLATDRKTIGPLVDGLFDFVEKQSEYDAALSLYDISLAVRDYFSLYWKQEYSDMTYSEDLLLYDDVNGIKTVTIEHMKFAVLSRYVSAGSMSEEEARKMLSAIDSHLEDMINTERRRLYSYFRDQYPDVQYDEYRNDKRSRFEYIMHLSEEYFLRRCREVFSIE
jgi:hypothetical protein